MGQEVAGPGGVMLFMFVCPNLFVFRSQKNSCGSLYCIATAVQLKIFNF